MGSRSSRESNRNAFPASAAHTQISPFAGSQQKLPELEINTYQAQLSHQQSELLVRCYSVTGELLKYVQQIRVYVLLEELECELFSLCRDYQEALQSPAVSLESVELVHHLSKLQEISGDLSLQETEELWADIHKVMEVRPLAVVEYKWTDRVLTFLSRLLVKWELVDVNLYKYRNNISPPVGRVQEQEYLRRQTSILCMDTVWFACACTHPPMSLLVAPSLHKVAAALHTRLIETFQFAIALNRKVNFLAYPQIEEAIGFTYEPRIASLARSPTRDSPEKPVGRDKRSSLPSPHKLRVKSAKKIGFHLLNLPTVPCKCLEKEHQRRNVEFRALLSHLEQLYRVFELEFLETAENMKAGEREETDTVQSRVVSLADSQGDQPENWMS